MSFYQSPTFAPAQSCDRQDYWGFLVHSAFLSDDDDWMQSTTKTTMACFRLGGKGNCTCAPASFHISLPNFEVVYLQPVSFDRPALGSWVLEYLSNGGFLSQASCARHLWEGRKHLHHSSFGPSSQLLQFLYLGSFLHGMFPRDSILMDAAGPCS